MDRDYGDLADIQIKIFEDALQIWSPGFLPFGVTVEELHQSTHSSKPRNRLIAQMFYDMGMIEKYGSGTGRVINACKAANLPEPDFANFSGGFRILFTPRIKTAPPVTPQVPPKHPSSTPQVSRLLRACIGEMGRDALMTALDLKDSKNFRTVYLKPALNEKLIEMTEPAAVNSPTQKYRLTAKGKAQVKDGE